jgi:hypothetical protein
VTVDRRRAAVVVEGRLRGRIVQACILSPWIPVTQELDETSASSSSRILAEERDPESGEASSIAQAGRTRARCRETCSMSAKSSPSKLSLAADPYPRKPGCKLEAVLPKPRKDGRHGRQEPRRPPVLQASRRSATSRAAAAKLLRGCNVLAREVGPPRPGSAA